jgi:hydroxymethylpyrimidine kinase / phosphomethylpyrimidine kinase / thiamine-phosphate diphosphorylase
MNIKYSEEVLEACREMGLGISFFDRAKEPEDVSVIEWGISEAIKEYAGVPEVIYDKGAAGKEPVVRLLGTSASKLAKLAVELARKVE